MAVVENGGGLAVASNFDSLSQDSGAFGNQDLPNEPSFHENNNGDAHVLKSHDDQSRFLKVTPSASHSFDRTAEKIGNTQNLPLMQRSNGEDLQKERDEMEESFNHDMRELRELISKLNPWAKEFVPSSLVNNSGINGWFYGSNALVHNNRNGFLNGNNGRRRKNYNPEKRRMNNRTSEAQREDIIRRTVYVSDIDYQVTEEQLAALFINCGQVVDCRICGDPNSVLRFAFIEFTDEEGAHAALNLGGTMLGFYPVRVLPSKTAIAPVNQTFLPRTEDEREMCARTIYCTNIDKKVTQADVKLFFESVCGEVYRLRLLGDYNHSTRIAFVEFIMAESAIAALNCSGVVLGSLPIRVSPSKTPVRPRVPRLAIQ